MTTEKGATPSGQVYLQIPITKIDEEQRIVEGIATAEVLDTQGDIVDFDSACKAFEGWEGNIREQHDPRKAVGRAVEWKALEEQKAVRLAARISKGAQDTWEKIKDKTLKYFSIASPFGGFERKPETLKGANEDGSDKTVNRLFLKQLSEVSLVDQGACPAARIELVKADGAATDVLDLREEPAPVPEPADNPDNAEKITEGASNYADPGWQPDGKKRYPLDTEQHVRAAAVYFARKRNRAKYTAEQQKKIDAKIWAAKKKFKIGEFAEKASEDFACLNKQGEEVPWVPMEEREESTDGQITWVPRTFADVYEDVELREDMPKMIEVFKRCLETILYSSVDNRAKRDLMLRCVQEFFAELDEEISDQAAESSKAATPAQPPQDHPTVPTQGTGPAGVEKHDTDELQKVAGQMLAKVDELKAELTGEIAKVAEIMSKHEGELAKVGGIVADVCKRLEVVEKQPAMPIVRADEKVLSMAKAGATSSEEDAELAALIKAQESMTDPVEKHVIGKRIALLQMRPLYKQRG